MDNKEKKMPVIYSQLKHTVEVPEIMYQASGISVNGKRIKSLLFSTDVAIIANTNADAIIAVYPFTPTMQISNAIMEVARNPVFVGVGGGTTNGPRVYKIAMDAEMHGAAGVVLNAPIRTEMIKELSRIIDIPIVLTVASIDENLEERMLHSGANIINVSGGKNTVAIVKALREISADFPIIATGGPTTETIKDVIDAGANAVTYTPPTSGDIFKGMMEKYRKQCKEDQ